MDVPMPTRRPQWKLTDLLQINRLATIKLRYSENATNKASTLLQ